MNEQARKSLERIVDRMERQSRRRRHGISTAPFVLAAGLLLADLLLTQFVPRIWDALLPRGLEQATTLVGWPGVLWYAAVCCRAHQGVVRAGIIAVTLLSLFACRWVYPLRPIIWLSAAGVLALNALILVVTLQTSLRTTAGAVGIDLG